MDYSVLKVVFYWRRFSDVLMRLAFAMKFSDYFKLLSIKFLEMKTNQDQVSKLHAHELYLHFYDDFLTADRTNLECDFTLEKCRLEKGDRLLDLACGHGRHAIRFSELGLDVCGVDMNSEFISIAKKLAKDKSLEIDFIENDILELNYANEFDAILLAYNSFGFFSKHDGELLISIMSKALKVGGRLFIDIKNKDNIQNEISPSLITEKGEDLMIDRFSYDAENGAITNKRIYIKDGKRYDTPFTMQLYDFLEMEEIMSSSNLKILDQFGDWNGGAPKADSRRIVLVLEKRI